MELNIHSLQENNIGKEGAKDIARALHKRCSVVQIW